MSRHTILVENRKDWQPHFPVANIIEAKEYIANPEYLKSKHEKVINLCCCFRFLCLGFYCSLLAEARWHRVIPIVMFLSDLSSKAVYSRNLEDLDELGQKILRKRAEQPASGTLQFHIFFGQCEFPFLQDVARQIFDQFPCPLLRVELMLRDNWVFGWFRRLWLRILSVVQQPFFIDTL